MKISQMIRSLEEAREFIGSDADVVVGEANGTLRPMIEVVAERDDEPLAIVQAYIVKPSIKEGKA